MTWLATRECLKFGALLFTWVPACGAFPRRLVYFLKVEHWAIFHKVLQWMPQLLDPDLACDKCSVVKLLATCNCLPHVGKEIPAEGLALTDLSIDTNACRRGTKPPPPGFSSMHLWSGCSLSQLAMQLVGTTGEGGGSLSAWDSLTFELDMGLAPMIGLQYAYFLKLLSITLP